jgi:tRNA-dihydrouridine synthase A
MEREAARHGTPWPSIARHMMGLRHGTPGARRWRQVWSDHQLKGEPPRAVWSQARRAAAAIEVTQQAGVDATPIDAKNAAPCA